MNIALFSKRFPADLFPYFQSLIDILEARDCSLFLYKPFFDSIKGNIAFMNDPCLFQEKADIKSKADVLFSIGGDGTLLDTVTLIGDSGIPILGINTGRLGFLASIAREEIDPAIEDLLSGNYTLDQRTLVRLTEPASLFAPDNYALNEISIYKKAPRSMLTISAFINEEFLNSYWADGLIVATPTGSTAYSLSCTGPILTPRSQNLLITPIATHTLTARPIVIPDDCTIRILVEGRDPHFFVTLDSRTIALDSSTELVIRKESFTINLIQFPNKNFFKTIREKLMWGRDIRN